MTLQRSPGGLANLHLFFKVARVVYCEGGAPTAMPDIENGAGDEETLDVAFWQSIFLNFGSKATTHFKSVGSKTVLLALAKTVIQANVKNVLVCLDRDFDFKRNIEVSDPRVIYTFGYSWENDLFDLSTLEQIFFSFRNRNESSEKNWKECERQTTKFLNEVQRYCDYDLHFVINGAEGMFYRKSPAGAIQIGSGTAPKLNQASLKARLQNKGYKRGPRPKIRIANTETKNVVFGKLLSNFMYQSVKYFTKPAGQFVGYDAFMRFCVTRFLDAIRAGQLQATTAYYSGVVP